MNTNDLTKQHCVPCEGGVEPFSSAQIAEKMALLKTPWDLKEGKKITKTFKFKDFKEAIGFVNKVAEIAEKEEHHPDITINYNKVVIELWTHAIGGLSINDFILASKIDLISI